MIAFKTIAHLPGQPLIPREGSEVTVRGDLDPEDFSKLKLYSVKLHNGCEILFGLRPHELEQLEAAVVDSMRGLRPRFPR